MEKGGAGELSKKARINEARKKVGALKEKLKKAEEALHTVRGRSIVPPPWLVLRAGSVRIRDWFEVSVRASVRVPLSAAAAGHRGTAVHGPRITPAHPSHPPPLIAEMFSIRAVCIFSDGVFQASLCW